MNVLFVYAHQDPESFGAAMHNLTLGIYEKRGDVCVISDLYASGFHAVAEKWDFKTSGGAHTNYMLEQKRVSAGDASSFAEDIKSEIAKIRKADLIIFEFPVWWSSTPAILKGWFDKVFALGVTWDGDHRYRTGLLAGKKALVIAGAGDSKDLYSAEGLHGATIEQHLYPLLHSTLAHAGLDVYTPFIATGLTSATDERCQTILDDLQAHVTSLIDNPTYLYKHST